MSPNHILELIFTPVTISVSTVFILRTHMGKGILILISLASLITVQAHSQSKSISLNPQGFSLEPQNKYSPRLQQYLGTIDEDHLFQIEIFTNDPNGTRDLCSTLKLRPEFVSYSASQNQYAICKVNKKQLIQLSLSNTIQHLELVRSPAIELKQEGLDLTLNEIKLLQHKQPDLAGNGMILSIKEDDFDSTDVDFRARYFSTALSSAFTQLHSTNMASIAGGGGNSDPTAKGVAWDAFLTSSNFEILLPDPASYFDEYGITVQNHSYGTGIENYYGIESMAYDELCHQNQTLIHVFSSGNDGDQAPSEGRYIGVTGWANITGQFKQSKNTIAVGATDSLGNVVPLSSRGPAYDGRIKPELVAYGHGGTSGAAAIVSGVSLLIQEAYLKYHQGIIPSTSLVKAILINTASDVGRPGPDFESGYGSVRAYQAIQSIEENQFVEDQIQTGETLSFPLQIPEGSAQVKVTLAWTDPSNLILAPFALINDLDLRFEKKSNGEIFYPWILSTIPYPDSLSKQARRGVDTLNTVEQITITLPEAGEYEMHIDGHKILSGSQAFSINWHFEKENIFHWTYPTQSDYLVPGEKNIIRWKTSGTDEGKIEYRNISNNNWILVKEVNTPSDLYAFWTTPDDIGLFQLRWMASDTIIFSDTFVVADPLQLKLGFLCEDSLLLHWPSSEADSFEIFRIGESHLEHYQFTDDTSFIEHNIDPDHMHYAAAGYYGDVRGPLSYGLDVTAQATGCYVNSFFLSFIEDGIAHFEVNLGSLYNVRSVVLFRWDGDLYSAMDTIQPVNETKLLLESYPLWPGVTRFIVGVFLNDGTSIYSDDLLVYYAEAQSLFLFPNPAHPQEVLNVINGSNEGYQLMIVDDMGREIIKIDDAQNPQEVSLSGLVPGHYMAVARYRNGNLVAEGFIVRE